MHAMVEPALADHLHVSSPTSILHKVRSVKSEAEVSLMASSGAAAAAGVKAAMRSAVAGRTESYVAAEYEGTVKRLGAWRLSFPCVVASGRNALTLHYLQNQAQLKSGEMILMDSGCEYHGYASDITRTWPVLPSSSPDTRVEYSEAQRQIVDVVCAIQRICMEHCKADGKTSMHTLHQISCQLATSALQQMGILQPGAGDGTGYFTFYPHSIGHHVGMDVHDCGAYSSTAPLVPGNCVTIEPGLYIPMDAPAHVPDKYRGIGVRIEDYVVVNPDGAPPTVLCAGIPRTCDEVEAFLNNDCPEAAA
jgi:Xaa-Pro aminopeptidase